MLLCGTFQLYYNLLNLAMVADSRLIGPNRPMLFKGGSLKWAKTFKMIMKHKIDLRNGFLTSENLEIVVLHKVLRQIGAKPLQGLKPLAAILDLLHTGIQRALTSCLRSFSKSLWSWLTLCKISKTWPEVHDSCDFSWIPPQLISQTWLFIPKTMLGLKN